MRRKLIIILCSIFIIHLFIDSSCDSKGDYIKISGFEVELYDRTDGRRTPLQNGDTTYVDTLRILTYINTEYIVSNSVSSNTVYAYDPPKSGMEGLKSKIHDIVFSSSESFQGLPPNTNLNEFVTCNYLLRGNDISIDSMKSIFNDNSLVFPRQLTFYINAKPDFGSFQKFKMLFEFENSEIIEFVTPAIVWL